MVRYDKDPSYGYDRLANTIALVKGKPVWIKDLHISEDGFPIVSGSDIHTGAYLSGSIDELDTTPIHIGFTNGAYECRHNADYISRAPYRQWKQGMRSDNLVNLTNPYDYVSTSCIASLGFYKSCLNMYPTLKRCVEDIICEEADGQAFHKEYALVRMSDSVYLYNKATTVGHLNLTTNNLCLAKDYEFLEQELEEILSC